jgi:Rhodopirellula transposase DDE domain
MQLLGAAQALEPIQEDARAGRFDTLRRLLDTPLGDGRQKPGLGHGRFKPAALITKVQLGQFDHHGWAGGMIRVAVHGTRPHLDRSGACAPCGGTRGDPESLLRWICKSTRTLAAELCQRHHPISYVRVAQLLREQNYSLQSNRKLEEGEDHPDRDAQFRHISTCVKRALAAGRPVISVDTKKKELVGNYGNAGQQWLPAKQPRKVEGHDFAGPEVPRAFPYGIFDLGRNAGFVNGGPRS